jgi:hypothetical protein
MRIQSQLVLLRTHHTESSSRETFADACLRLFFRSRIVWPRANADAISRAVGKRPVRGGMGLINDAAAGSECSVKPRRGMLASNGHIDMHRVPQGLSIVERLHPNRGPIPKRIDHVLFRRSFVAQDGAPEPAVDLVLFRGNRKLHFLNGGAIGRGAMSSSHGRHRAREFDVLRLETPHVSTKPNGKARGSHGENDAKALQ